MWRISPEQAVHWLFMGGRLSGSGRLGNVEVNIVVSVFLLWDFSEPCCKALESHFHYALMHPFRIQENGH